MNTITLKMKNWKKNISRAAAIFVEKLVGAYAGAEPKQRRRLPLLSSFLLITTLVTLSVSLTLRTLNIETSNVMLATSGLLLFSYFISRTRFYIAAITIAILAPAIPSITTVILHPQAASVTAELMWLALPLLIASFMLSIRETIFVGVSYNIYIILLSTYDALPFTTTVPIIAFMIAITFFVITITNTRIKDQLEIETQFKELQQVEEELRDNEEKFRNLFEYAKDAIFIADADTGVLVDVNEAGCAALGLPKDKIIGKPQTIIHPPEMVQEYKKIFSDHVKRGVVSSDDTIIQRADGTRIPANVSASVIKLAGRTIIQGVFRDVSERKQAEEALRESEEKFHTIVEHSNDGVVFIKNGIVQYCNPKLLEIGSYIEAEIIGKPFLNFVAPDSKEKVLDIYRKRMAGQKTPDKYELNLLAKDGRIVNTEISASLVNIKQELVDIALVRDITARKKVEETLANEATRRRILIEQSSDGIVIIDQDGNVYEANQRFAEMLGYSLEEVRKLKAYDWEFLLPPERTLEMIRTVDEKGDHFETQHRRKDGTTFDVEISTNGATIAGQKLIFCVCRDITERKQMAKSIKESEEKFSKAFMSSPQAVVITSLDDGVIIEANETFEELTGYSRKELVGRKAIELDLWNSPEERKNIIKALNEEGVVKNLERQFRNKAGEINTWLFSAETINVNGKPCMLSVTVDISERKKSEERLRFSDAILKSIHEGIFAMDNEFKMTRWNEICEQMFGIKASDAIGKPVRDVLTMVEEYPGQNKERINQLMEKGTRRDEQIYRTTHGDIWVDVHTQAMEDNGKRTGWVTLLSDITERKRTEEALKYSEEKYRELINTSTDAIVSTDPKMLITIWNQGAENIFGYTESEMLGQSLLTIFQTDLYKEIARAIINVKSSDKIEFKNKVFETLGLKKDCSLVPIEVSLADRYVEGNHILTAIIRDITTRKEAEKKLREIDQMKSEFLSNVSHELRTPLQSIGGFTKLIMTGKVPDQATQHEFLNIIDRETMHLGNLINSLLDMSRLESGRFKIYKKLTSLSDIFTYSIKMFHSLAREKNISLTESISPNLPEIEIDSERMRQVIINLIGNAIKFSEPDSSVHVKVEVQNKELLFQVIDHGTGIKEESMKHLFERFYRAEGETVKGGTGLGLYISKQIIEAHNGKIWAESKFGEGSTFSFILPLNSEGGKQNVEENSDNRRRSSDVKASRLLS
jgi:PAS domain S-box-containing protein